MKLIDIKDELLTFEGELRIGELYIPDLKYTIRSLIKVLESNSGQRRYVNYWKTLLRIYEAKKV